MGRHCDGKVGVGPKRREIPRLELGERRVNPRQFEMAVGARPAMTGQMLDDRQHASGEKSLGHGATEARHHPRLASIGAIADDGMAAGRRYVENGGAVDRDADFAQIAGNETADKKRGAFLIHRLQNLAQKR